MELTLTLLAANCRLRVCIGQHGKDICRLSCCWWEVRYFHHIWSYPSLILFNLKIAAGADPGLKDAEGLSCLHIAAQFGHTAIVAYFIAKGLSPDLLDRGGMTPIMWVSKWAELWLIHDWAMIQFTNFSFLGCMESSGTWSCSRSFDFGCKSHLYGSHTWQYSTALGDSITKPCCY